MGAVRSSVPAALAMVLSSSYKITTRVRSQLAFLFMVKPLKTAEIYFFSLFQAL